MPKSSTLSSDMWRSYLRCRGSAVNLTWHRTRMFLLLRTGHVPPLQPQFQLHPSRNNGSEVAIAETCSPKLKWPAPGVPTLVWSWLSIRTINHYPLVRLLARLQLQAKSFCPVGRQTCVRLKGTPDLLAPVHIELVSTWDSSLVDDRAAGECGQESRELGQRSRFVLEYAPSVQPWVLLLLG